MQAYARKNTHAHIRTHPPVALKLNPLPASMVDSNLGFRVRVRVRVRVSARSGLGSGYCLGLKLG